MAGLPILRRVTDPETGQRVYVEGSTAYPSTTTVIRVLDKPALRSWYARQAVDEAVRVAESLDGAGSGLEVGRVLRERAGEIAGAANRASRSAADRGIAIHEIVRDCIAGRAPTVAPEHIGYVEAFTAFLRDHKPRFLWTEAAVINRRVGYAGTCDAIGYLGDERVVVDWKTCASESKAVVYDEHRIQIAAYRRAERIIEKTSERPMPRTNGGRIVHLWPGGYRVTAVECGREEFAAFRGLLAVWTWMQKAKLA